MKGKVFAIFFAIIIATQAKVTKKMRNETDNERELDDMGANDNAEQVLDASDSAAIDNAAARMVSLVDRVNRLKTKLRRELETTVSYLRYHFNQRDTFDKRVMKRHLNTIISKQKSGSDRRLLDEPSAKKNVDQAMLKDYGKINTDIKNENFDIVKPPHTTENLYSNKENKDERE